MLYLKSYRVYLEAEVVIDKIERKPFIPRYNIYIFSSSLTQQPLSVKAWLYPLVKWVWLSVTFCYHSRIVSPTVYSGLEPMTGMLLRRTSWRLYHQTGPYIYIYRGGLSTKQTKWLRGAPRTQGATKNGTTPHSQVSFLHITSSSL